MSEALAMLALLKGLADAVEAAGKLGKLPNNVPSETLDKIDAERKRLVAQAHALSGAPVPVPVPVPAPPHYQSSA